MNSHLVITSISHPNEALKIFASQSKENGVKFILIGDTKSPADFNLEGCDYYSVENQQKLPFEFAQKCPVRHYSRKNIGYLIAIDQNAEIILETDDDNFPRNDFWNEREAYPFSEKMEGPSYINVYKHFTEGNIWPRGFPLEKLQEDTTKRTGNLSKVYCPIQQGLADENPDVDAIYRLTLPLPFYFTKNDPVALGNGAWCPFNSQNTTWFPEAYPLLYLPSYCSFRMTDIWRSYVAQRICWVNNWSILFHNASVWQERNEHNLMKDFTDEIEGYTNNLRITEALASLNLKAGFEFIGENLLLCYTKLIEIGVVSKEEIALVVAWNSDLKRIKG